MNKTILLTGATGFLGGEVLKSLIDSEVNIICIVRSNKGSDGAFSRLERTNNLNLSTHKNIEVYAGDVSKKNLGINDNFYDTLASRVTDIIHCAASTKFRAPMAELKKTNVDPIDNLVSLALEHKRKSGNAINFIHVSTAYQAGRRNDIVKENEFSKPDQGFKNNYEHSKWLAEQQLLRYRDQLKVVILRPSIIIASNEGRHNQDGVAIPLFGIMRNNSNVYPTPVPLSRNVFFDVVSVNYVSNCIACILRTINEIDSGSCFHATAGLGKELSGKAGLKIINKMFGVRMIGINANLLALIFRFLARHTNYVTRSQMSIMDAYMDYFKCNPKFDNSKMANLLGSDFPSQSASSLLEKTINYWAENHYRQQDILDTPKEAI